MGKDPAFLFYSADFFIGTIDMSSEQVGQYIRLMCIQHQKGHLSEQTMLKIMDGKFDEIIISKFQQDENGFYYNRRLETEIEKRNNFTSSRRRNLQGTRDTNNYSNCNSDNHMSSHMDNHMSSHMENENENVNINNKDDVKEKESVIVIKSDKPQIADEPQVIVKTAETAGENPSRKTKKATPDKIKYSDYVSMKPKEYDTLIDEYGEPFVKACIQKLDLYKGANGKTYKDDYRAILSWVVDEIKKTKPSLMQPTIKPEYEGNPFAKYRIVNTE